MRKRRADAKDLGDLEEEDVPDSQERRTQNIGNQADQPKARLKEKDEPEPFGHKKNLRNASADHG